MPTYSVRTEISTEYEKHPQTIIEIVEELNDSETIDYLKNEILDVPPMRHDSVEDFVKALGYGFKVDEYTTELHEFYSRQYDFWSNFVQRLHAFFSGTDKYWNVLSGTCGDTKIKITKNLDNGTD